MKSYRASQHPGERRVDPITHLKIMLFVGQVPATGLRAAAESFRAQGLPIELARRALLSTFRRRPH